MSNNEKSMEAKIEELQEIEAYIDELTKECNEIKTMIKGDMESLGVDEIQYGRFNVKWFSVITNKLDLTKFKKECTAIYNQYLKSSESKRLLIA